MKKLFLFLISLSILSSCQDDNKVDPETPDNSYRLIQAIMKQDNGYEEKYTYKYQDDKFVESILSSKANNGWLNVIKYTITYPANNIAEMVSSGMVDTLQNQNIDLTRIEYKDNKPIEITIFTTSGKTWTKNSLQEYEYISELLGHYTFSFYNNGDIPSSTFKEDYYYKDHIISESRFHSLKEDGTWSYSSSKTYFKSDDKMIYFFNSINADTIVQTSSKTINYYTGGKITRIEHYYLWPDMTDWKLRDEADYTYNSEGYLIKGIYKSDSDADYIIDYKYEKGANNMDWFISPELYVDGIPGKKKKTAVLPFFISPFQTIIQSTP